MEVLNAYIYRKLDRIDDGQGQNSAGVWRAYDPQLDCEVAVKEMEKSKLDKSDFFREAKMMFQSEHPNVVPVKVAVKSANMIGLIMPLCRNGSLATKLENGPLRLTEVQRIGQDILAGVAAIHAVDCIHLDIKPSNVLFGDGRAAMIADFGQARDVGPSGFAVPPRYMYGGTFPPECLTMGRGWYQSDIYQVGVTLYRAVNGEEHLREQWDRLQARGKNIEEAIKRGRVPLRSSYLPHVPASLRRVINRAMEPDLTKRFPSARSFASALGQVDPVNDWVPTLHPDGGCELRSDRGNGRPSIIAKIKKDGGRWAVRLYTDGKNRRKLRTADWRIGLNLPAARQHLQQVIRSMERT